MTRLVSVVIFLALLAGCSFEGEEPKLDAVPIGGENTFDDVPAELLPFYQQKLKWRDCRTRSRCAELTVPLDYAKPAGRTIKLSLLKLPATKRRQRIGSLVVNPGGPGGSGIDYAAGGSSYWGKELRAAFDIVGVDPRGVGESAPLDCVGTEQMDDLIESDPTPDDQAELAADHARWRAFFDGCMDRSRAIATHMATEAAARDLDVLRSALGEAKLVYFGASYGTYLGGTYADLFPARSGRLVLDGAIDPAMDNVEQALVQARGFETALRAYIAHCVKEGDCFLGDTVDQGVRRVQEFLAGLDSQPIRGSESRSLTEGLGVNGLITPLYNRKYWPILDEALAAALRGSGAELLALADFYTERGPEGYTGNIFQVLPVVNCLDFNDPVDDAAAAELLPRFEAASPTFGRTFVADLGICSYWADGPGRNGGAVRAEGSAPILVVGTTRDPATPLEWAEALAAQLDNARLVKRDGDGHTGYHAGNRCVDDTVEAYLVSGVVPADTVYC